MFFRKESKDMHKLSSYVRKVNDKEFIFLNINDDLGMAVEGGSNDWPPIILMAYSYVRRAAISALYVQGVVDKDIFEYVKTMFHGMQQRTDPSVDFQNEAASLAFDFIKSYNQVLSALVIKKIVQVAEQYEIPKHVLSDQELISAVINLMNEEQRKIKRTQSLNVDEIANDIAKGVIDKIISKKIARQFVLEELDAASQGNDDAVFFAQNSGFSPWEYSGAMRNSYKEVDGPDGPQQYLLKSISNYSFDIDFMVKIRVQVVRIVIAHWGLN